MTVGPIDLTEEIPCHRCGYDVRAQPADGRCPECEAGVAASRQLAKIPVRPVWAKSDPRWRRRVLVGVWLWVLLPLVQVLGDLRLLERVPVPGVFSMGLGTFSLQDSMLANSMLANWSVFESVVFCMGAALICSREGNRRRLPLDWTRRWGVLGSYVVLLIAFAQFLFIAALVAVGIGALLQSIPPKYQPGATSTFVNVGSAFLRHGPHPQRGADVACLAFSATVVLLACVALFRALRSWGPKWIASALLTPLIFFAAMNLMVADSVRLAAFGVVGSSLHRRLYYFDTTTFSWLMTGHPTSAYFPGGAAVQEMWSEVIKWLAVLLIALWLTAAQVAAWWGRRRRGVLFS
jgi:hypothetical protein